MDIKQLKYFLAITEENSITKAAKKLHISQPPLSHQLKILEEEIGSKLFDRTTRNLEITEVGEFLKNRAIQILELINETVKEIKQNQEELEGILKIGFVASSTAALVPKVIPEFSKNNPEVKFELKEGSTYKILDLLNHGTIEIGFIRTPFNSEEF
ncbi:LysR family transcriptional regulator, partial [Cetobacterium sp.]